MFDDNISGHAGVHTLPIPSSHHGHSPGSSPTGSSQHSPTSGDKRQRASSVEIDPGKLRPVSHRQNNNTFHIYIPCNKVVGGVYWFHHVRPSVDKSYVVR